MVSRRQTLSNGPLHRQQGAALLVLLTIVVLAASYSLLKRLNREQPDIVRAGDNAAVLGEAKAALIGYALSSNARPGELPCPDYGIGPGGLDGLSDACDENGMYVTIGRLPWKTLGLPDLRDAGGESLWYAPDINLDGNFQINSETSTNLRVVTNNTVQIAAVVIAPGKVTSTQSRPQNVAAQTTPARYLEASNAVADPNISVVAPTVTAEFTDQVLVITRDELIEPVERRVLAELKQALDNFGGLPSPAGNGGVVCNSTPLSQGLLPVTTDATCGTLPAWPTWFSDTTTGWQPLIWYAMDPLKTITVQDGATSINSVESLLIAAGPIITGIGQIQATPRVLSSLLDTAINNDGLDLAFETLPISPMTNDQLLIVR